jgi:hypothetical protein
MMGMFGTAFLIAGVVQQDAIPGMRQDWLARPVRRTDLLLSKLLFVVVVVQVPILVGDLAEGLALGFSLQESIGAAISRSVWLLFAFDLPLLAFGTLTRTLTEAVAAGVVVVMGFGGLNIVFSELNQDGSLTATLRSGLSWIAESTMILVAALGITIVLALQYYSRKNDRRSLDNRRHWRPLRTGRVLSVAVGFCDSAAAFAKSDSGATDRAQFCAKHGKIS